MLIDLDQLEINIDGQLAGAALQRHLNESLFSGNVDVERLLAQHAFSCNKRHYFLPEIDLHAR